MDLKRVRLVVVVLVVVSLIFSAVVSFQRSIAPLSLVKSSILASDGTIYLIDESEEYSTIYHIDTDGKSLGYVQQDKITNESYYDWNSLYLYGSNLYFILYTNYTSDDNSGQRELYTCNFDTHSVEKVLDLQVSILYSYYIKDDTLNIITNSYEDYFPCIYSYTYSIQFDDSTEELVYTSKNYGMDISSVVLDSNDNSKYFQSIDNELYRVSGDNEEERLYPLEDGLGGVTEVSYDNDNRIYFIDYSKDTLMYYDISKGECEEYDSSLYTALEEYNQSHGTEYALSDLKNFQFLEDGYFTASINTTENTYALFTYSTNGIQIVESIEGLLSVPMLILTVLVSFLVSLAVLLGVVGVVFSLKRSYVSLIVRMFLTFLCLYGVMVALLFSVVKPYLTKTFENQTYDNALYICQNKLNRLGTVSNEDVEVILDTDYNDDWDYISEEQYIVYSIVNSNNSFDIEVNDSLSGGSSLETSEWYSSLECSYAIYFMDSNGSTIMVYDSSYVADIPIEYRKTRKVCEVVQNVVSTGEKQFTDDIYIMQHANALYAPIFNEDGEVVGVFEVNLINNFENSFLVNEMIDTLVLEITIVVLVLIVVVSIMLYVFLHPLKDLKDKAISLTFGNLGVKVEPKGNNEITALAVQFNRVSQELEQKVYKLNTLKDTYQYYIPSDVCTVLKKLNVSAVSVGDTVELPTAVMRVRLSMDGLDVENRTFVTTLNRLLREVVTITNSHGGFIEHFDRHTIKVLYYRDYANAIRTAVSINEWVNTLKLTHSSFVPTVNVSVSFENVDCTIIGNHDRMNFVTYSENALSMEHLKDMYGSCSVVVTDEYIQRVPNFFETFDSRFIGLLCIGEQRVKLFEVFNGNDLYNKNMKRIHKDNFEKAVRLYLTKDFRTARNIFIEVFEDYPKDVLSKNYIRLCDELI